ncbi:MAG: FtsQ-type POTRA domain-containing protein [Syntrophales bacterium]|nr:FtsQ-type POTRA domain-containing protein [Syntrophales bacterium]
MKKRSINQSFEVKRNRLKRRSGKIFREIAVTVSIIFLTAIVGLTMVYGYNFIISSEYFNLKDTTVRGISHVSEEEVLTLSGINDDTNILTANLDRMRSRIKTNPWVKDVRMGREMPDRLVIEIEERRPVALVSHEKNFYIMDDEGTIFKNLDHDDQVDLPVMTGFSGDGSIDEELLRGALELLDFLSSHSGYPALEHISEIRGDHLQGYSLFTGDLRLYMLGYGDYDIKFRRLRKVLVDLTTKNLSLSPLTINLTDPGRIVVRHGGAIGTDYGAARKRTDI